MAKRDINYIKFIKPQVKQKENEMKRNSRSLKYQKIMEINIIHQEEPYENKVCKEAAKMSSRERLMNYAVTKDPTYLGVGCKWDMLTQMGRDKFGKIIRSLF